MSILLLLQNTAPLTDILLIIFTKSLTIVGFYYLMRFWVKKSKNIKPSQNAAIFFTWILGLFFTFMQPFTVLDGILRVLYDLKIGIFKNATESTPLLNPRSLGSFSSLISIFFYIYINRRITRKEQLFHLPIQNITIICYPFIHSP